MMPTLKAVTEVATVTLAVSVIALGVAAIGTADTVPEVTVTIDDGWIYTVCIDQTVTGPGTMHIVTEEWDGAVGTINMSCSAPYRVSTMAITSAEYIADSGEVYTWDGEVRA